MIQRPDELPKSMKREIRDLSVLVHERLLAQELAKLEAEFSRWRLRETSAFELSAAIHRFHEGPPRQLWLLFNTNHIGVLQERLLEGLSEGMLQEKELSEELLTHLRKLRPVE